MTEDSAPWYRSFFDPGSEYQALYRYRINPRRTKREARFARKALGLQAGDAVLDLCCGQGRHAVALAEKGLAVTGLDLATNYLEEAQAAAAQAGVTIETVQADMREIPFTERFDAVINMFSSFGYLESDTEDARVLEAVFRALKPGGRLLLDLLNREWATRNYIPREWRRAENGALYLEERELDLQTSRNHISFSAITADGEIRDLGGHHIRLYTLTEIIARLQAAGLEYVSVVGGYADEPYDLSTNRMIVIARKPV